MAETNPVIAEGQLAFDRLNKIMSIGDGTTEWRDLPKVGVPYPPKDGNVYVMVNGKWGRLDWDDIVVHIAPNITSALDLQVYLGQTLTYTLTADDATDATYTVSGMPEGMTYNSETHTVTWEVPADADWTRIHTFTARVETDNGADQQTINIVLLVPEEWKPKITPNQVITVAVGEEMSPYQILGQNITITSVETSEEDDSEGGEQEGGYF